MSIYPVTLSKWYPARSDHGMIAIGILSYSWCAMCGQIPPYKTAIADHSLPWGYYRDIFCNKSCAEEYRQLVRSLDKDGGSNE